MPRGCNPAGPHSSQAPCSLAAFPGGGGAESLSYLRSYQIQSTGWDPSHGVFVIPTREGTIWPNVPFHQNHLHSAIIVPIQDETEQHFPLKVGGDGQSHDAHDAQPRLQPHTSSLPGSSLLAHLWPPALWLPALPRASLAGSAAGHVGAVRAGGKGRL